MKVRATLLALALSLAGYSFAAAIESVSLRVRAMGANLNGIVPDAYTDLLADPARLSDTPTQLTGTTYSGNSALTLGYFSRNSWGVIGDWYEYIYKNNQNSITLGYDAGDRNDLFSADLYTQNGRSATGSLELLKTFKLFNRQWGIALIPGWGGSSSDYHDIQTEARYDTTGKTVYFQQVNSFSNVASESLSFSLQIGNHARTATGQERDAVLTVTPGYSKQNSNGDANLFTDYDPDGDKFNSYSGYNISTSPYYNRQANSSFSSQDNPYRCNVSLEYRVRTQKSSTVTDALVAGLAYLPDEYTTLARSSVGTTQVQGIRITEFISHHATLETYSRTRINAYTRIGRAAKFHNNTLLLACSVGLDVTTSQDSDKIIDQTADTLLSGYNGQGISGSLYSSFGMEYLPLKTVSLRAGVSPAISRSSGERDVSGYNIAGNRQYNESSSQNVYFSAGFGFRPIDALSLDLYTAGTLATLSDYELQLSYSF